VTFIKSPGDVTSLSTTRTGTGSSFEVTFPPRKRSAVHGGRFDTNFARD